VPPWISALHIYVPLFSARPLDSHLFIYHP
jgi:hypothetical protein